jgi:HEPN domain-containing protein
MHAGRDVIAVAREWVAKAENDLTNAVHTLKLGPDCPTDTVCFHAQQCVEKYLKAALVLNGISFPRVHNIEELIALMPESIRPDLAAEDQERLTDFATVSRYPGTYDPITLAEARRVVNVARHVRAHMRKALPRAPLPKNRR